MLSALGLLAFASLPSPGSPQAKPNRPRLVLVISIDQFRADYLRRFESHYLSARSGGKVGGFRWLTETGANYTDAHHMHVPTATGPGHATILTGSEPNLNGIVGNDWYDRKGQKPMYCVDDESVETVGGTSNPMSPRNLLVTTVGDELKMATAGRAKVVAVALKDRGSILLAGHAADTVIWFDGGSLGWVTSSFYAPSKRLPKWVESLNSQQLPRSAMGKTWEPLLSAAAYTDTRKAPGEPAPPTGKVFSHTMPTDRAFAGKFVESAFSQDYTFAAVKEAIVAEGLGQDEVPDVLGVNLATNDYVGHAYGPNSPEVLDISVRTDRLLSELFNFIQAHVPGGLDAVTIAVTADHGVVPIPEEAGGTYRTGAGRATYQAPASAAQAALEKAYGPGKWVLARTEPNLYLNDDLIVQKGHRIEDAEKLAIAAVSALPSVYCAFSRTQILGGVLPQWDWTKLVANGYHPKVGGNLIVVTAPGWYNSAGTGTGHAAPWPYDSHVPVILRGFGVRPVRSARRVSVADIAPTLSQILGIEYPSGCVGKPLEESLRER
jgi:predicted AlkP superfamily pyrophosphatase or phosphodiesterase